MNTIQNSLFEAMQKFNDKAVSAQKTTTVIEGTISEIKDEGLNLYSIDYMSNKLDVYGNKGTSYSIGDKVYILIPNGDFSKTKTIINSSTITADNYVDIVDESSAYRDVSNNFIDISIGDENKIVKLSSYETKYISSDIVELNAKRTLEKFNQELKGYIKDYQTLVFSIDVKTFLDKDQQNTGNYGATLSVPVLKNSDEGNGKVIFDSLEYSIDVNSMLGNPYDFGEWTTQSIYIEIDKQYTYDTTRVPAITFFCDGFMKDASKVDIKDIWIKSPSLKAVEKLTEEDLKGYKLEIKASEGEYFNTYYAENKQLSAVLKINGKNTSLNSSIVYWFKEDAATKIYSEDYSVYGGNGWRCLNEKTSIVENEDGTKTIEFNTLKTALTINKDDVEDETRYKCIVIYNDNVLSSIVTLKNLNSGKYIELIPTNGSGKYIKDIGRVEFDINVYMKDITDDEDNKNNVSYYFNRYDKNNEYINDLTTFFSLDRYNEMEVIEGNSCYVSRVSFPVYEVEDLNTLICSAYYLKQTDDGTEEILIGSKKYSIVTSESLNYNVSINNGSKIFKYDSDGDSPMIEAYDGPAESKVNVIEPLSYQVFRADGTELTEDEYFYCKYKWIFSKNSMIIPNSNTITSEDDDNYYIEGYGKEISILYDIASRYDKAKSGNTIILQIEFANNNIEVNSTISFIKDGDSGTNGTTYSAITVMGTSAENGIPYGVKNSNGFPQKLKFVYNTLEDKWRIHVADTNSFETPEDSQKRLFVRVWHNGERLDSSKYNVNWEMYDPKFTNPCFEVNNVYNGGLWLKPRQIVLPETGKDTYVDYNDVPISLDTLSVNIAKATINILDDGNTSTVQNTQTTLYAYYPIEFVISNYDSEKYKEYGEEYSEELAAAQIIPSVRGGFSNALYSADGMNPKWDSSEPFEAYVASLYDDVFKNCYHVNWTAQNNISPKSATDKFSFAIKPDNRYMNGDTKNYVKAVCTFDQDMKQSLQQELEQLKVELEAQNDNLDICEDNLSILQDMVNYYNSDTNGYKTWINNLNNISLLLNAVYAEQLKTIKFKEEYVDDLILYLKDDVGEGLPGLKSILDILEDLSDTQLHGLYYYLPTMIVSSDITKYEQYYSDIVDDIDDLEDWLTMTNGYYTQEVAKINAKRDADIAATQARTDISEDEKTSLIAIIDEEADEEIANLGEATTYLDSLKKIDLSMGNRIEMLVNNIIDIGRAYFDITPTLSDSKFTNQWALYEGVYNNLIAFFNLIPDNDNQETYDLYHNKYVEEKEEINKLEEEYTTKYNTILYNDTITEEERKALLAELKENYDAKITAAETKRDNYKAQEPITEVYQYITNLKRVGLEYVNKMKNELCSLKDLIYNIQEDINFKVLGGVFSVAVSKQNDNHTLFLSPATENKFDDDIKLYQNVIADIEEKIFQNKRITLNVDVTTVIVKPITFTLNCYEMSNINGWDGNKLELGDSYLIAPQVGAGLKDSLTNAFTGVVMGVKSINNKGTKLTTKNSKIGLFGYSDGEQSFCLSAKDGSAVFGKFTRNSEGKTDREGGQIIIDPSSTKALLYSSNFFKASVYDELTGLPRSYDKTYWNGEGLLIDLTTPEIRYGNGKFIVDKDGNLTVVGSDNPEDGESTIAGWVIGKKTLYSNKSENDGRLTLSSLHYKETIDDNGNRVYYEDIDDQSGCLFSHSHKTLDSLNNGFYLGPEGLSMSNTIRISSVVYDDEDNKRSGCGTLEVGNLTSDKHFTIGGYSTSTEHGNKGNSFIKFGCEGWADAAERKTNDDPSKKYSLYMGTDGFAIGQNFSVNNNGEMKLSFGPQSRADGNKDLTMSKNGIKVNGNIVLPGVPKMVLSGDNDVLTIYYSNPYGGEQNDVPVDVE